MCLYSFVPLIGGKDGDNHKASKSFQWPGFADDARLFPAFPAIIKVAGPIEFVIRYPPYKDDE
jgi:hypothetical protein